MSQTTLSPIATITVTLLWNLPLTRMGHLIRHQAVKSTIVVRRASLSGTCSPGLSTLVPDLSSMPLYIQRLFLFSGVLAMSKQPFLSGLSRQITGFLGLAFCCRSHSSQMSSQWQRRHSREEISSRNTGSGWSLQLHYDDLIFTLLVWHLIFLININFFRRLW